MGDPRLYEYVWYHGPIRREETERLLLGKRAGLFLVRDSSSLQGDYVLSVSENGRVSHYIINNQQDSYQIGDQRFADLPAIIEFYRKHFLDSTTLIEPCKRKGSEEPAEPLRVRAKYNFPGNDTEDLPFKKNDILTIVKKEEPEWWLAKDSSGREGMIPVPYVEVMGAPSTIPVGTSPLPHCPAPPRASHPNGRHSMTNKRISSKDYALPSSGTGETLQDMSKLVPFYAEAVQDRNPSIYDQYQLKFKRNDRIRVINVRDDGTWEGELQDGTRGFFPFTHVRALVQPGASNESNWNGAMH